MTIHRLDSDFEAKAGPRSREDTSARAPLSESLPSVPGTPPCQSVNDPKYTVKRHLTPITDQVKI